MLFFALFVTFFLSALAPSSSISEFMMPAQQLSVGDFSTEEEVLLEKWHSCMKAGAFDQLAGILCTLSEKQQKVFWNEDFSQRPCWKYVLELLESRDVQPCIISLKFFLESLSEEEFFVVMKQLSLSFNRSLADWMVRNLDGDKVSNMVVKFLLEDSCREFFLVQFENRAFRIWLSDLLGEVLQQFVRGLTDSEKARFVEIACLPDTTSDDIDWFIDLMGEENFKQVIQSDYIRYLGVYFRYPNSKSHFADSFAKILSYCPLENERGLECLILIVKHIDFDCFEDDLRSCLKLRDRFQKLFNLVPEKKRIEVVEKVLMRGSPKLFYFLSLFWCEGMIDSLIDEYKTRCLDACVQAQMIPPYLRSERSTRCKNNLQILNSVMRYEKSMFFSFKNQLLELVKSLSEDQILALLLVSVSLPDDFWFEVWVDTFGIIKIEDCIYADPRCFLYHCALNTELWASRRLFSLNLKISVDQEEFEGLIQTCLKQGSGGFSKLRILLRLKGYVEDKDLVHADNEAILMKALSDCDEDFVYSFLRRFYLDCGLQFGTEELRIFCVKDFLSVVQCLLEERGLKESLSQEDRRALVLATIASGKLQILKYFIETLGWDDLQIGDNLKESLLYQVCLARDIPTFCVKDFLSIVQCLLEERGLKESLSQEDRRALVLATIASGKLQILKYFIETLGWDDLKVGNNPKESLLYHACLAGDIPTIQWLFSKMEKIPEELMVFFEHCLRLKSTSREDFDYLLVSCFNADIVSAVTGFYFDRNIVYTANLSLRSA